MRSNILLAATAALVGPVFAQQVVQESSSGVVGTTVNVNGQVATNNQAATTPSTSTSASGYKLAENFFDGAGFFSHFDFFTGADPTHGLVQFVSQAEAQSSGLISSTANSAWMGADSKTVLTGNTGRKAVRVSSKKAYTHMLVAVEVDKIPVTCGGWPAFWSFGPNWPANGEIDIIEGVNTKGGNKMTLHTSAGCSANGQAGGLLKPDVTSCEGNQGCGFTEPSATSFQNANQANGGIWAMQWNSQGISVWWWGGSNKAPADVFGANPNPAGWGPPSMNVPNGNNCNIDQHFKSHNIIFDWTFCGDWAGNADVWAQSGCSSSKFPTCQSYVQGNPSAYAGQGFDVKQLKVYTTS